MVCLRAHAGSVLHLTPNNARQATEMSLNAATVVLLHVCADEDGVRGVRPRVRACAILGGVKWGAHELAGCCNCVERLIRRREFRGRDRDSKNETGLAKSAVGPQCDTTAWGGSAPGVGHRNGRALDALADAARRHESVQHLRGSRGVIVSLRHNAFIAGCVCF